MQLNSEEPETGIVYLVQPEEYVHKVSWYKIGRTKDFLERMGGYGKFTKVISVRTVQQPSEVENVLRVVFRYFFKLVRGNEYFEGDIQQMYYKFEELTAQRVYIGKFLASPVMVETSPLPPDPAILEAKEASVEAVPPVPTAIPVKDKPTTKHPYGRQCARCGLIFSNKYVMKTHFEKELVGCYTEEKKHVKISDRFQKNVPQPTPSAAASANFPESGSGLPVSKAT